MLRNRNPLGWILLLLLTIVLGACGGGDDSNDGKSIDLTLSTLSFNTGTLEPAYDPQFLGPYTLNVDSGTDAVTLTAIAKNTENRVISDFVTESGSGGVTRDQKTLGTDGKDTRSIIDGENTLSLIVFNDDRDLFQRYNINIQRPSNNAKLGLVSFSNLARTVSVLPTPAFTPDETSYAIELPYSLCSFSLRVVTEVSNTQVLFGDQTLSNLDRVDLESPSPEGENSTLEINLETTAELGDTLTYSFAVTRAAGTEEEINGDATLKSLAVTGGDLTGAFHCGRGTYTIDVSNSADVTDKKLSLTPEPSVSSVKSIELCDIDSDDNSLINCAERAADASAFELDLNGVSEDFEKVMVITAADDSSIRYDLNINILDINRVRVGTTEELKAALAAAKPGDEIYLTADAYTADAADEASGEDMAVFFAAASGTAETPVYLRGNSASLSASGSDGELSVLKLSGDYWDIRGLEISGGKKGVILDAANRNLLQGITVRDVAEQGVEMRSTTSNNVLLASIVQDIGKSGSNGEAVVVSGANNAVSNVLFQNIPSESVDIDVAASGTLVQSSEFRSAGDIDGSGSTGVIAVKGANSTLRFNSFNLENVSALGQVIRVMDGGAADTLPSANVYQNSAQLSDSTIAFVNSLAGTTTVAENSLVGGAEPTYVGVGSFSVPNYQIQYGTNRCLDVASVESGEAIVFADCSDAASQRWAFSYAVDGAVRISPASNPDLLLYPASPNYYITTEVGLILVSNETPFDSGFAGLWSLYPNAKEDAETNERVTFVNRASRALAFTIAANDDSKPVLALASFYGDSNQDFVLIPQ